MIELAGIRRTFRVGDQEVRALVDIDASFEAGEYIALMGPSGSGKSTLLNILGCLDRPDAGTYRLAGREVGDLSSHELTLVRRHEIGFVFQFFHLVPRLTAARNVELPMLFAGVPRRERRRRVEAALAAVDISNRADHRPDQLSGGQRQRVAIARATVMEPRILLADEPTGNLDRDSSERVLEVLETMNAKGLTLVVVTHDPRVARRADRVLLLVDGQIAKSFRGSELPAGNLAALGLPTPPESTS